MNSPAGNLPSDGSPVAAIIFAVLTSAILLFIGSALLLQPPAPHELGQKADSAQDGKQPRKDDASPDRLGTYPDWIIAVAAVIALGVYALQAKHMGTANRASTAIIEQMHLEKRAWIGVDDLHLEPMWSGEQTRCTLILKNTGGSPGTFRTFKDVIRLNDRSPDEFDNIDKAVEALPYGWYDVQMVLPPGATVTLPLHSSGYRTLEEIQMIEDGGLDLAAAVYFEYVDIAGVLRKTQCAYRYDLKSKSLVVHQEHNFME